MKTKTELSMQEISKRVRELNLPDFDLIVGIATGGLVPASLLAYKTMKPMQIITLNYRDEENNPIGEEPKIMSDLNEEIKGKKILLVDDVSVSGKTFEKAKSLLEGNEITTFVMKGKGDYVVFPEVSTCVKWPWKSK